jgi:N-acetylneuraminate lyase
MIRAMPQPTKITGLIAATHTPFHADGSLRLELVEQQAEHLQRSGINTVFIGGTTGESHSLQMQERRQLAQRWMGVSRGTPIKVIVQVGTNCLEDGKELAAQAGQLGAAGIAAFAPSYFKLQTTAGLVSWCAAIAGAAPETPFYFYDIPLFTHTSLPMPEFLDEAHDRIPSLAGLKFTNPDLLSFQVCLDLRQGAFDVLWGLDEFLLAALAVGGQGAVGASYNFAAPAYHRLWAAFSRGDLAAARQEQLRGAQVVKLLAGYGFLASSKAVMQMIGVDVGPARLPIMSPTPEQLTRLRAELEELGFFDWRS